MTPKEKARELNDKYNVVLSKAFLPCYVEAKKCALIAVDEMLNTKSFLIAMPLPDVKYWNEVKQEIQNL